MTKTKNMKIRVTKAGGHFDITFWTGNVGYTFANIGTLRMDESSMWLLVEVLSKDERVISIEREDLVIPRGGGDENSEASPDAGTLAPRETRRRFTCGEVMFQNRKTGRREPLMGVQRIEALRKFVAHESLGPLEAVVYPCTPVTPEECYLATFDSPSKETA